MAPESEEKSVETDEFIYPDQILEAMEYSLQECQECQSRNIENLNLGRFKLLQKEIIMYEFQ